MESNKVKKAFDKASIKYDNYRKQVIPLMEEYYKTAIELTSEYNNPKVLDLGAGTGILTYILHKKHPQSEITLIDISHDMLKIAKEKFKNLDNFKYIEANYLTKEFPEQYDIIISSLSIHHLTDLEKKELYKKIYDSLNPNGVFINVDQVKGPTTKTEQMYKDKENSYLEEQNIPNEEKNIILERRKLDQPATLYDNIHWFKTIGYKDVDIFFKYYRYFVIYGKK